MKAKIKNRKERRITLIFTIFLFLIFVSFMFYRHILDINYREIRCSEDSLEKMKTYRTETGRDPEEVVIDMFHEDCMRDSGWLK